MDPPLIQLALREESLDRPNGNPSPGVEGRVEVRATVDSPAILFDKVPDLFQSFRGGHLLLRRERASAIMASYKSLVSEPES
jgi:hypothetical protein